MARANWRAERNGDAAEIDELRAAANETARVARSNLLFLLVVGLYLGILVAQTDDMLLLTAGNVDLPIMQVGIPVVTLYVVAPVLFLLLHFNLILRLGQLATALRLLRDRLAPLPAAEQLRQRVMVYPFDFARLILDAPEPRAGRLLLFAVVVILVAVLPLALLLCMQLRFLAYQDEVITLTHQITVTLDLALLIGFVAYLARTLGNRRRWPRLTWFIWGRAAWASWPATVVLLFLWSIAVVPDGTLERVIGWQSVSATAFGDRWVRHEVRILPFRRYLDVSGQTIAAEEPLPEEIGGLRAKGEKLEPAWDRVGELDLSGRSFLYAQFGSSRFKRVVLQNADLSGAELFAAELHGSDLQGARLRGAFLVEAGLHGTSLRGASLQGANLFRSELHGADLSAAILNGADLGSAELHGADLSRAELHGTDLVRAELQGATLQSARLYGVLFSGPELRFVDIRNVEWAQPLEWSGTRERLGFEAHDSGWADVDIGAQLTALEWSVVSYDLALTADIVTEESCVWHDADGPTASWPEPAPLCAKRLALLLAEIACRNRWTAKKITSRYS